MRTQLTAWAIAAVTALGAAPAWAAHTPLVEAVKAGNQRAVLALIQQHVDVNAPEADGATALHWAVENADQKMVDLLIRNHANVQAANRYGVTPLVLAATNGNDAIADALLRAGANPNTTLPEGETVLMTASRSGHAGVVKALGAHGGPELGDGPVLADHVGEVHGAGGSDDRAGDRLELDLARGLGLAGGGGFFRHGREDSGEQGHRGGNPGVRVLDPVARAPGFENQ